MSGSIEIPGFGPLSQFGQTKSFEPPGRPVKRGARPHPTGAGLRIRLSRRHGLTRRGILEEPFYFQCPPLDSFRWSGTYSWNDYDTLTRGQFSRPGGRQLRTVEFQTLMVDYDPPWAAYDFSQTLTGPTGVEAAPGRTPGKPALKRSEPDPLGWTKQLRGLMWSGTPFNLLVGAPDLWGEWDIRNMLVTLRSLDVEERGGEVDARYVNVSFTEYRDAAVPRRKIAPHLPATLTVDKHGTLRAKDQSLHGIKFASLAHIARFFYGSSSKWRLITRANPELRHFPPSHNLSEYVIKHHHKRPYKFRVPALPHHADSHSGKPGTENDPMLEPTYSDGEPVDVGLT